MTKTIIDQFLFFPTLVNYLRKLYRRLYRYLEELIILYPFQPVFREKCLPSHALISITESIRQSIDNNEFGCGIFVDLKKAFDTVNHAVLLTKLTHALGIKRCCI